MESNPYRNNYLKKIDSTLDSRLEEFRCTDGEKKAIKMGILDEMLRGAYKLLRIEFFDRKKQ